MSHHDERDPLVRQLGMLNVLGSMDGDTEYVSVIISTTLASCGCQSPAPKILLTASAHEEGGFNLHIGAELSAADALLLANRLNRAASLVLENDEDAPDPQQELAMLLARDSGGEQS